MFCMCAPINHLLLPVSLLTFILLYKVVLHPFLSFILSHCSYNYLYIIIYRIILQQHFQIFCSVSFETNLTNIQFSHI